VSLRLSRSTWLSPTGLATGPGKVGSLDELAVLTGRHRDYARAVVRHAIDPPRPVRPGRAPVCGADLQDGFVLCRAVLRARREAAGSDAAGARADASGGEGTGHHRRARGAAGQYERRDDRPAAGRSRAKILPHGRSHTKPGSLLKSQIPVRT